MSENADFSTKSTGLQSTLKSIDTRSTIAATIIISVLTIVFKLLFDLCCLFYWLPYFRVYNIPLLFYSKVKPNNISGSYLFFVILPCIVIFYFACRKMLNKTNFPQSLMKKKDNTRLAFISIEILYTILIIAILGNVAIIYGNMIITSSMVDFLFSILSLFCVELYYIVSFDTYKIYRNSSKKKNKYPRKQQFAKTICYIMVIILSVLGYIYICGYVNEIECSDLVYPIIHRDGQYHVILLNMDDGYYTVPASFYEYDDKNEYAIIELNADSYTIFNKEGLTVTNTHITFSSYLSPLVNNNELLHNFTQTTGARDFVFLLTFMYSVYILLILPIIFLKIYYIWLK